MDKSKKLKQRVAFGNFLRDRRLTITGKDNLLEFSYEAEIDNSKLRKIENGEVNFGFEMLLQLQEAYKLEKEVILGFKVKA